MTIKPLFDYLVVDAKEKQETTKGGLIYCECRGGHWPSENR